MKKILILILILAIGLFGAVGVVSADETESGTDGVMRIHFIECGQADACLIELPDGKNMLIDAGDRGDSCAKVDEYLTATIEGERLDYVIMTHADSDHIGGITTVLSGHEIGRVYRPSQICGYSGYTDPAIAEMGKTGRPYNPSAAKSDQKKSTETYKKALEYCYTNAEEVYITDPSNPEINHIESSVTVDGETFGYTFDFYSPMGGPYDDANDYSPIMTLTYGGRNIVLSGDAAR